eukprot:scaffold114889_cov36-Phaeocystis_antarctica.AAC.2
MHRVLGAHEARRREGVAAPALGSGGGGGTHGGGAHTRALLDGGRRKCRRGLRGLGDGGDLHVPPASVEGELDRVAHLVGVGVG